MKQHNPIHIEADISDEMLMEQMRFSQQITVALVGIFALLAMKASNKWL